MKRFLSCLTLILGLSAAARARADTISTFDFFGAATATNCHCYSVDVNGTMTIDTTTGTVLSSQLLGPYGPYTAQYLSSYVIAGHYQEAVTYQFSPMIYYITFNFPQDTLVNYTGGALCSTSLTCTGLSPSLYGYGSLNQFDFDYGALTLVGSTGAIPEPSSLILISTGLIGIVGAVRRNYAKN